MNCNHNGNNTNDIQNILATATYVVAEFLQSHGSR